MAADDMPKWDGPRIRCDHESILFHLDRLDDAGWPSFVPLARAIGELGPGACEAPVEALSHWDLGIRPLAAGILQAIESAAGAVPPLND